MGEDSSKKSSEAGYMLRGLKLGLNASRAAGSGVVTVASATHEKIKDSDPGFILFIAGMLSFFFYEYVDNFWFALIIASFFMFYSSWTIFEGEGIVIVSLFFIWYVLLGGRYDISFIRYYAIPLAIVGMLIHGLVNKLRKKGTFTDGIVGELKGAAIPILLFVLDMGLLDILTNYLKIPLASLNVVFLTFVPWWGLLGLATTKKETTLLTVLKVLMVGYVIILLFSSIAPGAYAKYQQSFITGPQELYQARLEGQKEVKAENPLKSYGSCLISGRLTDLDVCVRDQQKKSQAEAFCKNLGISPGVNFDQCVKDELVRLDRPGAKGSTDSSRKEFLTAEFKPISGSFPKLVFNDPQKSYPTMLEIRNPLQQQIGVEITCKFTRGSTTVTGTIIVNGADGANYYTNKNLDPLNIICRPNEPLDGRYTFEVEATLTNIITTSDLTRAFVKNQQDRQRWEGQIKSTALSGFDKDISNSAAEFARLNFAFGNFPEESIIIADQPVILSASIEDLGQGQLKRVKAYVLSDLLEKGFFSSSGDEKCLQGEETLIPKKIKNYHLAECFLTLPAEYQQFDEPFIVDTFKAQLVYDYVLTQKVSGIEVQKTS